MSLERYNANDLKPGDIARILVRQVLRDGYHILAENVPSPVPRGALITSFANRVHRWMISCFSSTISADKVERNHRFFEEATELTQALGMTAAEAHELVDYVFGRPIGEPKQEVGGVMVTLAALCNASEINLDNAAETELARVWTKIDEIRAKQAAKPKFSVVPVPAEPKKTKKPKKEKAA